MGERKGVYKVCGEKPEVKRYLERPRRREKDNIRMDFKDTYWEGLGWIDLAQVRGNLREVLKE
jgi:hypothetical protein